MSEETILITGGQGFLGRIIFKELSTGNQVFTLGKLAGNDYRFDLAKETPHFERKFNTVIHTAGKAHFIPRTPEEGLEFFQVNYQGTVHLLAGLQQSNRLPQHFIFISSVAVYGLENGEMIGEDYALLGQSPYAKSKIEAEKAIEGWCQHHHVRLTILRLPLLVGPTPPGNLGALIKMIKRGMYVGIGSGTAKKSMVLAEDVAKFIPKVASIGGIFNLTDGVHPTVVELENAVALQFGKRLIVRLPDWMIKIVARAGDFLGPWFPLNSIRFMKLTSSLTFSDAKARTLANWSSRPVIDNLSL